MPKTRITSAEVSRIADLARLGITPSEAKQAAEKLDQILENFSKIQDVDTAQVPPADDVSGRENVQRPDEAQPEVLCSHAALLSAAPDTHAGHIKVKAIF